MTEHKRLKDLTQDEFYNLLLGARQGEIECLINDEWVEASPFLDFNLAYRRRPRTCQQEEIVMTTDIKIESDIPLPSSLAGRPKKYPFSEMNVGDSFVIQSRSERDSISGIVSRLSKKNGTKFTVRKTADGYRCWRIK